jgi:hypothetical protein
MTTKTLPPIHPGEILKDEFLEPLELIPLMNAHGASFISRRPVPFAHVAYQARM